MRQSLEILMLAARWTALAWLLMVFFTYSHRVHVLAKAKTGENAYGSAVFAFCTCVAALWVLVYG